MTSRITFPGAGPDGEQPARFGPFELLQELGSGSMGEVWLARDTRATPTRRVALKRITSKAADHPAFRERFFDEAAALRLCKHPNIVRVFDYARAEEQLYLSMEFVEGTDLGTWMGSHSGLVPPVGAVDVVKQAAAGLGEVHGRRIEHRDVKPSNLLIASLPNGESRVVVIDFGIISTGESDQPGLTLPNGMLGTPCYAAPEQWPNGPRRGVVGAMDQFALAVVAYLLLTGELPWPVDKHDSRSVEDAQFAARRAGPPRPASTVRSQLPSRIDAVLAQALSWEPGERYASVEAFAEALRAAHDGRRVPQTPRPPRSPRRRRRLFLAGVAAATVAAIGVAVAVALGQPPALAASPVDLPTLAAPALPPEAAATLGTPTGPVAVAAGPDGPRAFLALGGEVAVVDLRSRQLVDRFTPSTGQTVSDLASSADGSAVFVSAGGAVARYDASGSRTADPTPLPDNPGHAAVTGVGNDLRVWVPGSQTVAVVTPGSSSYGLAKQGVPSLAVAADPSSQEVFALVRDANGLQVQRVDPGGDAATRVPADATGLAVTADGSAWTASGGQLLQVDLAGQQRPTVVPIGTSAAVRALTVVDGDLYVVADDGSVVLVREGEAVSRTRVDGASVVGALAVGPGADCGVVVHPGSTTMDVLDVGSRCSR